MVDRGGDLAGLKHLGRVRVRVRARVRVRVRGQGLRVRVRLRGKGSGWVSVCGALAQMAASMPPGVISG